MNDTGSRTEQDAARFEAKRAWIEAVRNSNPTVEDQWSPWDDYDPRDDFNDE